MIPNASSQNRYRTRPARAHACSRRRFHCNDLLSRDRGGGLCSPHSSRTARLTKARPAQAVTSHQSPSHQSPSHPISANLRATNLQGDEPPTNLQVMAGVKAGTGSDEGARRWRRARATRRRSRGRGGGDGPPTGCAMTASAAQCPGSWSRQGGAGRTGSQAQWGELAATRRSGSNRVTGTVGSRAASRASEVETRRWRAGGCGSGGWRGYRGGRDDQATAQPRRAGGHQRDHAGTRGDGGGTA